MHPFQTGIFQKGGFMSKDKKSKQGTTTLPAAEVAAAPRCRARKRTLNEGGAAAKKSRGGVETAVLGDTTAKDGRQKPSRDGRAPASSASSSATTSSVGHVVVELGLSPEPQQFTDAPPVIDVRSDRSSPAAGSSKRLVKGGPAALGSSAASSVLATPGGNVEQAANDAATPSLPPPSVQFFGDLVSLPPLPPGVVDVFPRDADFGGGGDGSGLRAFVNYLWQADAHGAHRPNPERRLVPQATVTTDMRHCLVDWLVDVVADFKLQRSTLFLAVQLLDRCLDVKPVVRERLQLIGCVATVLAAKLEEVNAPTVDDMVDISANTYSRANFIKLEGEVCCALEFRLSGVTCAPFLQHFLVVADANPKQESLAWYLAELGLLDYKLVGVKASEYAAAVVHLMRQTLLSQKSPATGSTSAVWTDSLRHYTHYAPSDLEETAVLVHGCQKRAWEGKYAAVRNRYAQPETLHVSDYVTCLPDNFLRFDDD